MFVGPNGLILFLSLMTIKHFLLFTYSTIPLYREFLDLDTVMKETTTYFRVSYSFLYLSATA